MKPREAANKAALEALELLGGPGAVTKLAQDLGENVVDGVVDLISKQIDWKKVDPCGAAVFHREMARTVPRWRWLARYHHKRLYLRWRARCKAKKKCGLE